MLDVDKHEEFSKIAQRANDFLDEHDVSDFHFIGINWDGEENQWVVSYESDFANGEFISVWVSVVDNRYELAGHSFEPLYIKFF
jgi:hypothetical protein